MSTQFFSVLGSLRYRRAFLFASVLLGVTLFLVLFWERQTEETRFDEVYGLLHLVTRDSGSLSNVQGLNPAEPLPMRIYAAGQKGLNWGKEVIRLNEEYPVVVFSKTYCPYSQLAKALLETYEIEPSPKIIEVDLRDDGMILKTLLTRLTGRGTFPNILVRGTSIGGSDDLNLMHTRGTLAKLLEEAGLAVRGQIA